jgi:hypothetical protein
MRFRSRDLTSLSTGMRVVTLRRGMDEGENLVVEAESRYLILDKELASRGRGAAMASSTYS